MINICKGQYFRSRDDKDYIFLGYKNPYIIYCLDEQFENTGEILLFDVDFIENPLDRYNNKVKKMSWYYECREEFEKNNLKNKLDILLTNISNDFKRWEKEISFLNLDIRIKKVSDLVKGKAFFANQNQYYEVIGFLVETETYENNKKTEENKGLFSIYHSRCDNLAPMTFFYNDNKDKAGFYNKDTNDYCIVEDTLLKEEDISRYIKEHNYGFQKLGNEQDIELRG